MKEQTIELRKRGGIFLLIFMILIMISSIPAYAEESDEKVVRVGLFEDTYHKVNEKGELYGYGYEYLQKIASYNGWTLEYVTADWYNCFDKLENGEIDILNGISYTEERDQDMLFSTLPMAEERYYIYVDTRNMKISPSDIDSIDGKTVGVMVGAIPETVLNTWEADNNLHTIHTNITTAEDVLSNLEAEKMDCFVSVEEVWDQDYIMPVTYIGGSDVYFVINKERQDLKKELDNAMSRIVNDNPFYNDSLYAQYFVAPTLSLLSEEEQAWLKDHGSIRMGYIDGDTNVSEKNKRTGELTGVINDYIDYAKDCLGDSSLDFEVKSYDSLEEEITALQNGEIDMIFKVPYNSYYASENQLSLSNTSMQILYIAVTAAGYFDQNADNTVAVVKGDWLQEWYIDYSYPTWKITEYDSFDAVRKAVENGEADCFITRTGKARRYIKNTAFQVNMLDNDVRVSFGVARKDATLLSILNKTIKTMPDDFLVNALSIYDSETDKVTTAEFLQENYKQILLMLLALGFMFTVILRALQKSRKLPVYFK